MQVFSLAIKTHLWLGEEVLRDLEFDHKLTIYINGQAYYYDIPESTLNSLLNNRGAYLSGLMGPDAFPDPAVGQLIVHPGLFNVNTGDIAGWQTDDWLKHLNIGYSNITRHVQASSASTSNDLCLYELDDDYLYYEVSKAIELNLAEVEMTLESKEQMINLALSSSASYFNTGNDKSNDEFQSTTRASFIDSKFSNLQISQELDSYEYSYEVSVKGEGDFINPLGRRCYVGSQGNKNSAFSLGYMGHAISDMWAHTYVNMYSGGIFNINDGIEVEKRHILLEKYIAEYTPSLSTLPETITPPSNFIVDKLILNDTAAEQYKKGSGASHLLAVNSLYKKLGDYANSNTLREMDRVALNYVAQQYLGISLNNKELDKVAEILNKAKEIENKTIDEVQRIVNQLRTEVNRLIIQDTQLQIKLVSALDSAVAKHIEVEERILLLSTKIDNLTIKIGDKVAKKLCKRWIFLGPFTCKIIKEWNRTQKRLLKLKKSLIKERARLKRRLATTTAKNLKDVINQTSNVLIDTLTEVNEQIQLKVDLAQRFNSDINVVRAYLLGWQSDVKFAMKDYSVSWNNVIKSSAYGHLDISDFEQWIACRAPSLAGIPSEISLSVCSGIDYYDKLMVTLDKLSSAALNLALPIGGQTINDFKDEINGKLKNIADDAMDEVKEYLVMQVIDRDFYALYKVFNGNVSDYKLNTLFSSSNDVSLISIPDIASRVRAEMQTVEGGEFNPQTYPVIFNSLQLMKLSLLDEEALNDVLNIAVSGFPQYMPIVIPYYDDNVIYNVLRSIDGNHQWLDSAPPYPRNANSPDMTPSYLREFGLGAYEDKGLIIWKNETLRKLAFNKLFKGPLSQGLEQPKEQGLSNILPERYPYRGCRNEPFPMSDISYSCGARLLDWLLPVLFINN